MANSARPSANEAVVITPMAASAPIARRRVTPLISSADATPQHAGAEHEVDAEQGAGGEPAEDRVGQAVADVAHALEHDEHADEPAQRPGDRGDDDAVAEELEVEGAEAGSSHVRPRVAVRRVAQR